MIDKEFCLPGTEDIPGPHPVLLADDTGRCRYACSHRASPAMLCILIVSLAVDTHGSFHGVTAIMKDKPCLSREVDSMCKNMTVHATTDTLTATDKATDNAVDMDPKQSLVSAIAHRDIHSLRDKVLIHAGRIAAPECTPVSDTFFTRLRYRS